MSVTDDELIFESSAIGASIGGATTGLAYANTKGDFFGNISQVARLAGGTVTKKWFLANESPVDALISPYVWIDTPPTYIDEVLGLGYNSADDDDPAQGNMTPWDDDDVVEVQSSGADPRIVTVTGLDATGLPQTEDIALTGTTPALGLLTFSVVYGGVVPTLTAVTVTIRQGAAGTTRGTIGPSKKCCWLWVAALTKGTGIHLPDLPSLEVYGFWDRLTWPAIAGVRPNYSIVGVEEA